MSDVDSKVANLEKHVAVLQNESGHVSEAIDRLGNRITPMQKQIAEIHKALHGSRGFMAGITVTVSVIWAILITLGIVVWNWLQNIGN